jgi:hypothetical protein
MRPLLVRQEHFSALISFLVAAAVAPSRLHFQLLATAACFPEKSLPIIFFVLFVSLVAYSGTRKSLWPQKAPRAQRNIQASFHPRVPASSAIPRFRVFRGLLFHSCALGREHHAKAKAPVLCLLAGTSASSSFAALRLCVMPLIFL